MTIGIILAVWLALEATIRVLGWALDRHRKRWMASLPDERRLRLLHLKDQSDAATEQVGPIAMACYMRSAEFHFRAASMEPGDERTRTASRALRWQRRADRLRRDRAAAR